MPSKSVRVMRPGVFGNPFLVSVYGQEQAIERHRAWLEAATAEELGYTGPWADRLNTLRAKVMGAPAGPAGQEPRMLMPGTEAWRAG